jgi:hypothetical protein
MSERYDRGLARQTELSGPGDPRRNDAGADDRERGLNAGCGGYRSASAEPRLGPAVGRVC